MEIHRVSLPTVNFIIINIMFGVTSAINVAAMMRNTQDTINSDTQTHSQDTTDTHIPTTPLSDCLSSLVSLSLSLTRTHKHNWDIMTRAAVCGGG